MAASGVIRVHTHPHCKFLISKNYLLESRNFILHTALMILEMFFKTKNQQVTDKDITKAAP